jgi:hypothetical protein
VFGESGAFAKLAVPASWLWLDWPAEPGLLLPIVVPSELWLGCRCESPLPDTD